MGERPETRGLATTARDPGGTGLQPRPPAQLGYTTQSDVASDQPWTLTPKWNVPGSGEVDAALGKFRLDESGRLSGEPLVMVELKGAKVDLDRKMPTRNITPVQQVWNYLNASESAQWAIVCNYAEIRLYSRQKSSNHLHRVFLTELDDPDKFAEFYAIFHADSLLGTGMFAQNTGWLLRETGERQEKVSVELYREYAERRVELIQELLAKGVTELDRAIEAARACWTGSCSSPSPRIGACFPTGTCSSTRPSCELPA